MSLYIDKDGRRINVQAMLTVDDTVYAGNILEFPEACTELGLRLIDEPTKPADYSEQLYEIIELDVAPYVLYSRKVDETVAAQAQRNINLNALAYLASTDWYVSRFTETGVEIPDEVRIKRQAARDSIVQLPQTFLGG